MSTDTRIGEDEFPITMPLAFPRAQGGLVGTRRRWLAGLALAATASARRCLADPNATPERIPLATLDNGRLRSRTLAFVESMRLPGGACGRYRYSPGCSEPTLCDTPDSGARSWTQPVLFARGWEDR